MTSRYTFAEYSSAWPAEFQRESARLRSVLGSELVCVHHIGSTSVPGLAAKPIIDLLPVAQDIRGIDRFTGLMEQSGYRAWGEYGIPGRRYFTRDRDECRTHNLHVFQQGDPQVERHLAFCAYLRSHEKVRDEYAALKREVYARHPDDINSYMDGKDAWIKRVEKIAVEWFRAKSRECSSGKKVPETI
jgi:GrpB-like predicted nucleotidyltransferase (UPF0157 family)